MESHVTHRQRLWLYALTTLVMMFLLAPTVLIIPLSFNADYSMSLPPKEWSLRWYRNIFDTPRWFDSFMMSLKIACLTVAVSTPIGVAAAYALHVGSFGFRRLIEALLILPIVFPVILIGIGLYFVYAKLGLINTTTGLVLAYTLLAIPYMVIAVGAGLKNYDMSQELVARSLGASRLVAFFTVTLPQIRLSVLSGALFGFVLAFDEVVIAQFLSSGSNALLTKVMFSSLRDDMEPTIAAVSTLLLVVTLVPPLLLHGATTMKSRKRP